jgi:hypothetical protein
MIRYAFNVLYLAVFFGAFTWYRRAVLAEYGIEYFKYGAAIVEALVLAKVLWLAELIGLVREEAQDKPLLYPTLQKAFVFTLFAAVFSLVESMVRGAIQGVGAMGGLSEELGKHKFELFAQCIVTFCAFIPFFAFRELARELGEGKLWKLFLKHREEPTEFGMPGAPV